MVEIRLLGRFAARRNGEEIPPTAFGGRMVRTLVRLLVSRRGEFVPHDVTAEALWPRRLPGDPVANLQVLVTRARRALGQPSLILTGPGGYSFVADEGCVVDADLFLEAVNAGRERLAGGQAAAGLRDLRRALDHWHGDPLTEDAYEDWAQEYRTRLMRAYLQALEDAAEAALAVRDPASAVALAETAVTREPLRESARLLLARGLAASGDSVAALRTLASFRQQLVEDTGLDPSADLKDLERRILEDPPVVVAAGPAATPRRAAVFSELSFVGRDQELQSLLEVVSGPVPGTALLCGAPGAGKSRLFAELASRSPGPVLAIRAFLAERDEGWGLARRLLWEAASLDLEAVRSLPDPTAEALADVVPDLSDLRPVPRESIDRESRRALALEAGVRLMAAAAEQGACLLVDDLQWADATSLRLLELVLGRVPALGVVLAYRPEEVGPDGPVASFLADLPAQGRAVLRVVLGGFATETLTRLIADEEVVEAIATETDATPLAVAEVLRVLAARGAVERDAEGRWAARDAAAAELARQLARSGHRRSMTARVARQPRTRRDTLALLALLGREIPARVVVEALAADEIKVLADLDDLSRAGLVRLGDGGWAPAHDLVGEVISEALEPGERGRLHHLLARALTTEGGDPAELARHLEGAGDPAAAAAAYADAAQERLERFAGDEAARLADAGLHLNPQPSVQSRLLEARAEARAVAGDHRNARADLREVLRTQRTGPERSRILARLAMLTLGEDFAEAAEWAEFSITEAGADRAARAEALAVAAVVDLNVGRLDRMEARSTEALTLFEHLGDTAGVARVLDTRAGHAGFTGRISEAADLYDRAARLYLNSGQLLLAGTPRAFRAWMLVLMGQPERALIDLDEALDLERTLGQTEGEALCLMVRADALSALALFEEARKVANEALATFRRLGAREWEASTLRVLGQVEHAAGNLTEAEAILERAVETASGMPHIRSRAAGQLASVLVASGDLESAEAHAKRARADGTPMAGYEPQLVLAEIALLRNQPGAESLVSEALARMDAGGYLESAARRRLERLGQRAGDPGGHAPMGQRQRRTFMFTDIVGSTKLVDVLGDEAWEHLLRWHDETLRSLFAGHEGEEVNRIGDGFFVAFRESAAAVACSIAIQRRLARHRLEHGFSPDVRIGLHLADATRKEGDYQGKGVHVAARIGALAEGGEILASQPTIAHVDALTLSEARSVVLSGLSKPIDIFAISWR